MNDQNPIDTSAPDAWSECEPGTLVGLGQRLKADRARKSQSRLATGALATAAAVLAIAFWPSATPELGGLTCSQCLRLMPEYSERLAGAGAPAGGGEISDQQAQAMAEHLAGCPKCSQHFEEMYPGLLAAAATAGLGLLAAHRPIRWPRERR